eukprot:c44644_g1_i1 orf=41-196(+)
MKSEKENLGYFDTQCTFTNNFRKIENSVIHSTSRLIIMHLLGVVLLIEQSI